MPSRRIAGGLLITDIKLACKPDRMAYWEPDDCKGDARNADPRIISKAGADAEAQVMAILADREAL